MVPGVQAREPVPVAGAWTIHAPIVIAGDASFTSENGVTGGTGTSSDPYIISGWNIDANATVGITVKYTTASFVIRDVFVHAGNAVWEGIRLQNLTHASVRNVTVAFADGHAIGIVNSALVNVSSSTLSGWDALWFSASRDSGAYDNTITGIGSGVLVAGSSNISVARNRITSTYRGIWSDTSDHLTLQGNTLAGAYWYSLTLFSSRSVTFRDNVMTSFDHRSPGGIELNVPGEANATTLPFADTHTITPDNTLFGLPILYYKDCRDTRVDGVPASQLIFAGCNGIVVSNETLGDIHGLVTLAYTTNWTLTRNSFHSGSIMHAGVPLAEGGRVVLNNFDGTGFEGWGGDFQFSLPYPIGGNYWSYYDGPDLCSGPRQTVCPDPDGIGDTPHDVSIFGTDKLPRMDPIAANNTPPDPKASVVPLSGVPSTDFLFDASASTDGQDPPAALEVRWDWNHDGVWDTDWSSNKTAHHSFGAQGSFVAGLEVRDSDGWLSMTSITVTVGSTPLVEVLAANWGAIVLVVAVLAAAAIVLWRRRPRHFAPVSDSPPEDEVAP